LLTRPQRELPIPLSDTRLFTQDAAGQAFIDGDPLKLTHATARFFYQSRLLDRRLVRNPPGSLRAAVTLVLAGRDRIVRNDLTQQWLRRIAASPPTVRSFPQASHTLEFERDRDEYGKLLLDWATGRPH
jgi:alpha-beta hydrolase superfamily lysophospholipase